MSKTVTTLALLGTLALALPAQAAEKSVEAVAEKAAEKVVEALTDKVAPPVAKVDLANATAGLYAIDPSHTNVIFRVSHLGFSGYMGRFNKVEGKVALDPKDLSKTTLDVTIDASSVDVNLKKLEDELRGKEMFDVTTHPSITFKSTKLEQTAPNRGTITGDLSFRGVTKPVTLDVTLNGVGPHPMNKKQTLGFSANGVIKRSDFGAAQWLPMVGDNVQLIIETELQAE